MTIDVPKRFIGELTNFYHYKPIHWLVVFLSFVFLQIPFILNDHGGTNMYVMLGQSLIEGKLNLAEFYWDASVYKDKFYCPFPPFPSLTTIPFILLVGAEHVNSVFIASMMACVAIYFLIQLIKILEAPIDYHVWILGGVLFGTGFWYTLIISHHVNGFAHVTCTALLFALLTEVFTKKRFWLMAILVGCAFLSRQFTLFYSLLVIIQLYQPANKTESFKKIALFSISLLPFILVYLIYNYARFENALDTGYGYLQNMPMLAARIETHGLFSMHYLFYNAYHMFIKGPNVIFTGVDLQHVAGIDKFGCSLFIASPFIIAAFKADFLTQTKFAIWVPLGIILCGGLLFHNNGFEQINTQRFSLDFLPLLALLIFRGADKVPTWLFKAMVVFAISLNAFSFAVHQITS